MKKILLLSTVSLAMLMADITLIAEQLTKTGESTPPPVTTAPVNTSGIIPNSVDLIWADMHDAPTGYPVASSSSYDSFQGPVFKGRLPINDDGWGSVNAWYEIEPATSAGSWCGYEIGTSENTAVELSPLYAWFLTKDGVWHQYAGADDKLYGHTQPSPGTLHKTNRGCNVDEIEAIRDANKNYDVGIAKNTYLPKSYYRFHGWAKDSRGIIDTKTIKAVFVTQYARLVKIDPDGADDFQDAEFVLHVSSDRRQADGSQIPGKEGWGIGGISRFKTVPKNGDWMPCNFLEGKITKAELDANPPPFPKHP